MAPDALATPGPRRNERDKVEAWREEVLLAFGFAPARAQELARRREVDIRLLEGYLARGASHEAAARLAERDEWIVGAVG